MQTIRLPLFLVAGAIGIALLVLAFSWSSNAAMRGDLNGDGAVNAADAAIALQIATDQLIPSAAQSIAGDTNADGVIDADDAAAILYYAANKHWPDAEQRTNVE